MSVVFLKTHILPVSLLVIVSLALFANTFSNPFIWDDKDLILDHAYIKDPGYIPFLFTPQYWNHYSPSVKGQYRPVRAVTFALDYFLWKENPFGYHLTNVAVHTLNTVLAYFFLFWIVSSDRSDRNGRNSRKEEPQDNAPSWRQLAGIPFLAAVLFAAHPIHTESITWIKNRSDLFALFFFLVSLFFFVRYAGSADAHRSRSAYPLSVIFFACALLSKETAVVFPLVLAAFDVFFLRKDVRKAAMGALPFFAVFLSYLVFKATALRGYGLSANLSGITPLSHILTVFKTIGYYLTLLAAPYNLKAERLMDLSHSFREPDVLFSMLSVALLVTIAIAAFRRSKVLSFALLWIFITLLPVSNILFLSSRPIAEQRLYIPSLGSCMILALIMRKTASLEIRPIPKDITRSLVLLFSCALLASYAFTTVMRNRDWSDPVTFWLKTAESSPMSGRAYYNLGVAQEESGNHLDAIDAYRKSITLDPAYLPSYNNLGSSFREIGKYEDAVAMYKKVIEIDPHFAESYNNLGVISFESGKDEEAVELYKRAIENDPDYADAYYNLGIAYVRMGKRDEAIASLLKAIDTDPTNAEAYNALGNAYKAAERYKEAASSFLKAIKVDENFAKAYNDLGALYATFGEQDAAIILFTKALEIEPDLAESHNNLAAVYYRQQQFDRAIRHCDRALGLGYKVNPDLLEELKPYRK